MTVQTAVYFFIPSMPPPDFSRLPKRSQERFGLEIKVVSAKISAEIRGDYPLKGPKKHQPRIDLDSFA